MKKKPSPTRNAGRGKGARKANPSVQEASLPIVGIGASAGGLEAFTQLLQHLPVDTGMAFVLVQHLDPAHESALTEILGRATAMPVREVTDRMPVRPNQVYVIPPDKRLAVAGGQLRLEPREQVAGAQRSIDFFLESLAREQQERAIGVILSGTASDGTLGLEAIKAEGGITFAQDGSAKYDSMPRNAVAAGCLDFVLSPQGIARELARIARHPYVAGQRRKAGNTLTLSERALSGKGGGGSGRRVKESGLRSILLLLRNQCGVDFSLYKPNTIQRRIARRMVLSKRETWEAYAQLLRGNEKEREALYSDVLIGVTSFFRNPEAFEALKRAVFAKLLQHRPRDEPVRVWVAGCSTGQEAYSIAMAYQELAENRAGAPELQVFATDLHEGLLERARQGLYPRTLMQDVSPERLRRFFTEEEGGYRVRKSLRDRCVFARHNLLSDPPFCRLDLVSCRNLLIYIEAGVQTRILPTFHYALKPNGFLFLGASESIGLSAELFEPVDQKTKIFCRKPGLTPRLPLPVSRSGLHRGKPTVPVRRALEGEAGEVNALREADRVISNRFAPPGVLIDANLRILQSRGATGDYLGLATGKASLDVLKMVRSDLMLPLRAALNKARKQGKAVRADNLSLSDDALGRKVNLTVIPLKDSKERYYFICFEEAPEQKVGRAKDSAPSSGRLETTSPAGKGGGARRIAGLERELTDTRQYLQSVQEQYEAANEELQASNEEVTSTNEELQSINEELETSKEELESSNEELTTVNEEMANRNQELNRLNSDLNNLHVSINTPILVLGLGLTIRRFTRPAEKVFNLLAGDVGRPLTAIRHNLAFSGLEEFIAEAISTLSPREQEVQDTAGNWYVLRVRPYLTLDNKIDGAVVLLVDVNVLKQAEQKLREARDFAEAVIESVPPLVILEPDLRVRSANKAFYATFGVTPEQTERHLIYELGNGQWNIPALRKLFEEVLPRSKAFREYEVTHRFKEIGRRTMLMSGRRVESMRAIVLSIKDITVRKEAEEVMRQAKETMAQRAEELERLVQERTAELRETIGELEHFSYSITHDMRAPLRAMQSFAGMLEQECAGCLQTQSQDYFRRIKEASARLDRLITDSLNYSKIVREELPLEPVEVARLLRGMIETYPDMQPSGDGIKVEFDRLIVLGNESALTQCFSNLLGNALKFVAPGTKPQVRVWAEPKDRSEAQGPESEVTTGSGSWVRIWVEDNGLGIATEAQQKIFGMFQRLHHEHEYPGTGMGLAIVRKAVQRIGGRLGLESEPGKGSRFWIELPRADGVS